MNSYDEIKYKANAVRDIDLSEVLKMIGARQDRFDKAKWYTLKGVISITGKKFINWNSCVGGGAMSFEGIIQFYLRSLSI